MRTFRGLWIPFFKTNATFSTSLNPFARNLFWRCIPRELLEGVRQDPLCSTAWHSVGAVVMAAEKIASGEVGNAFSFIGAGGHHSGKDFFGGYCCFNDVAIAIRRFESSTASGK